MNYSSPAPVNVHQQISPSRAQPLLPNFFIRHIHEWFVDGTVLINEMQTDVQTQECPLRLYFVFEK